VDTSQRHILEAKNKGSILPKDIITATQKSKTKAKRLKRVTSQVSGFT